MNLDRKNPVAGGLVNFCAGIHDKYRENMSRTGPALICMALSILWGCGERRLFATSDHFDGERYFNPGLTEDHGFWDVLKWQMQFSREAWPKNVENKFSDGPKKDVGEREISFTFINHASFLIQTQKYNILTDPVFSERVSPFTWIGPARVRPPGLKITELPPVHFIVISHNHYDHMDMPALKDLASQHKPVILVPAGDRDKLTKEGIGNVFEYDWGQARDEHDGIGFTFARSQHFSGRWLNDRFKALWGAWIIRLPFAQLYFAGDTGYSDHFASTGAEFGGFDLSFIPIGAYEPRWFMKSMHVNPAEAVLAHKDLRSKISVAMHHGTFQLTDEAIDAPVKDLEAALAKEAEKPDFRVMEPGQTWHLMF